MPLDFTLSKFHPLCSSVAQHYPTLTLAEYFQAEKLPLRFAIMRHDINRTPMSAEHREQVTDGDYLSIKVPYFKQESWYTCGPACLRMVLSFLGIQRTETEVEAACGTTELGTTAMQIAAAAQKFGLKASSTKNANIDDKIVGSRGERKPPASAVGIAIPLE